VESLDPNQAREELERILSEKEYQVYYKSNQNFLMDLLDRIQRWLESVLEKLFPNIEIQPQTPEWMSYGVAAIGITIIVILLILVARSFIREGRFKKQPVATTDELVSSTAQHLQKGQQLADNGEYRFALRHVFLAYILYLDEKNLIEARAWKTNLEYHQELSERLQHTAEVFYSFSKVFEEVMYGKRPITKDDYEQYVKQVTDWMDSNDRDAEGGTA
jgi:hypothetical protein